MSEQTHEPMEAHHIETEHGSHIEPPLEQSWSELDKLRWKAGTVIDATGIPIQIGTGALSEKRLGRWRVVPGMYSITYGSASISAMGFHRAWTFLNGLESGAETLARQLGARQCWQCRRWHVDLGLRCDRCFGGEPAP